MAHAGGLCARRERAAGAAAVRQRRRGAAPVLGRQQRQLGRGRGRRGRRGGDAPGPQAARGGDCAERETGAGRRGGGEPRGDSEGAGAEGGSAAAAACGDYLCESSVVRWWLCVTRRPQSASLPILPTWSLILLKFLLAVIGVNNANPMGTGVSSPPVVDRALILRIRPATPDYVAITRGDRRVAPPRDHDQGTGRFAIAPSEMVQDVP